MNVYLSQLSRPVSEGHTIEINAFVKYFLILRNFCNIKLLNFNNNPGFLQYVILICMFISLVYKFIYGFIIVIIIIT